MSETGTNTEIDPSATESAEGRAEGPDTEPPGGSAAARLSTAPADSINVPALGLLGWARWSWRQLTSMRVALILLFLLSLGAIPGSLIPQSGVSPMKVEEFRQAHQTLAPIYDRLGLFHVYSSVWYSAIYILLFVSLIGCIVPRGWQLTRQLRGRPPAAPRRLGRLPAYTSWRTGAAPEEVLGAAHRLLGRSRFRTHRSGDAVAAEKGYLREVGNLLFHIALIVILVAFAVGQLWKSEGGKLVVEGDGFSNTLIQYDEFSSGTLFDSDGLAPFGFALDGFDATFERTGPQKGTPRTFRARATYWEGASGEERKTVIEVNKPLEVAGNKVYLVGHGYAPVVTVRDGQGDIAYQGPTPFLPQGDTGFTSVGVIKVPDYRDKEGKKNQLGFQGRFLPTFALDEVRGPHSSFPALDYPVLAINAYRGDLGIDSGVPQSVYQLETEKMKQFKDAEGEPFRKFLRPGESAELPNGAGSIEFEGVKTWATFQVSHQPANGLALVGAVAALAGLAGSLFIQRRRVWVRASRGADGETLVELAGLGRSESPKLPEELADLAVALRAEAPVSGAAGEPAAEEGSEAEADDPATKHPDPEPEEAAGPDNQGNDPADPVEGARA
ncbi:cytochrome c biogenesis protein ResB [Streptomyces sp. TP-A0874]|uniref:cytochrome c biogenesis protein ResB n=1 Tax=Streptomyces sp. TP-A0874 TaxID=549819 RepID=UPI0008529578|nr:cytochrome c biogenesis protein ResB [Streptomyces sp. TP-A0874]